MTIYSLDVLLFLFGTSLLFHVQFWLLLPDLHIGFSRGRSGGLIFPSLSEFSIVYCDPHSQRLWHSRNSKSDYYPFSSVQSLNHVQLCDTMNAACQASLSITNSRSSLKLMCIKSVMPSNHLILCHPLSSCLQSFPASGSFTTSQFFTSGGQSIEASASASVLSMNIQDWFPLWLIGLTSLQSRALSRVFSNTTVQKHQFFGTQLSL